MLSSCLHPAKVSFKTAFSHYDEEKNSYMYPSQTAEHNHHFNLELCPDILP